MQKLGMLIAEKAWHSPFHHYWGKKRSQNHSSFLSISHRWFCQEKLMWNKTETRWWAWLVLSLSSFRKVTEIIIITGYQKPTHFPLYRLLVSDRHIYCLHARLKEVNKAKLKRKQHFTNTKNHFLSSLRTLFTLRQVWLAQWLCTSVTLKDHCNDNSNGQIR